MYVSTNPSTRSTRSSTSTTGASSTSASAPDHVVFGYDAALDEAVPRDVPEDWRFRQELTVSLASDFLTAHTKAPMHVRTSRRHARMEPAVVRGGGPGDYRGSATGASPWVAWCR